MGKEEYPHHYFSYCTKLDVILPSHDGICHLQHYPLRAPPELVQVFSKISCLKFIYYSPLDTATYVCMSKSTIRSIHLIRYS